MTSTLKKIYLNIFRNHQLITLDYHVNPSPRSEHNKPLNTILTNNINSNRDLYKSLLNNFLGLKDQIFTINKSNVETDTNNPVWDNKFLPGLDIISIYGILATYKSNKYIEIGSGNSTKVARKAIKEQGLPTKIISIDPYPRANIDKLADQVIRLPFENIEDNNFIVEELEENDILFIDNSHRVFPNSDAMIVFMEILPKLKKGVIVHFHDIYLPYDYPKFMCERFYNEQYFLATFIMSNPQKYKTILPNYFISTDLELASILNPLWENPKLQGVEKHGGSYWLQIR